MGLVLLGSAIVLEVVGTTFLKLSEGFSKPLFGILMFVFYGGSFTVMSFALKEIDVSVAYAIWSAMGTALIATIGILWFNEPLNALKLISLTLIIAGVVGLNLSGTSHG
ncbi:multidrug efflux SMR transporter [Candidatus Chlorohelix sp.]|uniref:DMT family transporter n=1 Tax=Candidatus Chlorohelix sp. TaxID=3139201 RepID=UPI0030650F7D